MWNPWNGNPARTAPRRNRTASRLPLSPERATPVTENLPSAIRPTARGSLGRPQLQTNCGPRILPVDLEIAHLWGQLTARAQRQGRQIAAPDGLIAATARHHGLPVMTRNVGDFHPAGVRVVNPWPG